MGNVKILRSSADLIVRRGIEEVYVGTEDEGNEKGMLMFVFDVLFYLLFVYLFVSFVFFSYLGYCFRHDSSLTGTTAVTVSEEDIRSFIREVNCPSLMFFASGLF